MLRSSFAPSSDDRVIAGVCAGIAQTLAVDVTLVRLVFALLALAGGAGIVLYLALWAYARSPRRWVAALLALLAGGLLLSALGLSGRSVVGIALIAAGLALAWRQGGRFHPDAPLSYGGIALAVIQRHATEPNRVVSLARRQERELRGWLYADQPLGDDSASLVAALSAAAGDVEELHGVRIELASAGDCPVDAAVGAVVLAAREAMTNAAKFAGVEEIDVYVEVTDEEIAVFVRDRGAGFDRGQVPPDRRGIAESIEGRLERAGGRATVVSSPGEGTEVELHVARSAS